MSNKILLEARKQRDEIDDEERRGGCVAVSCEAAVRRARLVLTRRAPPPQRPTIRAAAARTARVGRRSGRGRQRRGAQAAAAELRLPLRGALTLWRAACLLRPQEEPGSEDEAAYDREVVRGLRLVRHLGPFALTRRAATPQEVAEEDERALAAFMTSEPGGTRTLADLIVERLRSTGTAAEGGDGDDDAPVPADMDPRVVEVYRGVGALLARYKSGKVPKAFKIIPALANWEEVLYLTAPEAWTPHATFQATRLFASNLNAKMAQRFFNLVLLPRVRADILANRRLHFTLFCALKKATYKPAAFFKGLLLPLCQAGNCNLREAVIMSAVISRASIPMLHSAAALLKLAEMEYSGTNRRDATMPACPFHSRADLQSDPDLQLLHSRPDRQKVRAAVPRGGCAGVPLSALSDGAAHAAGCVAPVPAGVCAALQV